MTNLSVLLFVLLDIIGSLAIGMLVFGIIVFLIDQMIKSSTESHENNRRKLFEYSEKINKSKTELREASWQLTDKINKLKF